MANPEHLKILEQGVTVWNKWREENPEVKPDLRETNFFKRNFSEANFSDTDLSEANLSEASLSEAFLLNTNLFKANLTKATFVDANLRGANLSFANLSASDLMDANCRRANFSFANLSASDLMDANCYRANFFQANLFKAILSGADFSSADFRGANIAEADLTGADFLVANLSGANLFRAKLYGVRFIGTNLTSTKLDGAKIYGISAWDIKKDGLIQKDLIITPEGEPEITVDDLEVAQFIYLLLNNQKIRDVIETITSKAVLILGRFTEERKAVLDALKDELRRRNYLPIVFDFENAGSKSLNETMSLLARMSRFIVADITDAKAVREELALVIPQNPSTPVVPLVLKGEEVYSTFDFPKLFKSVLDLHEYDSPEILLNNIIPAIIAPAEQKVAELRGK